MEINQKNSDKNINKQNRVLKSEPHREINEIEMLISLANAYHSMHFFDLVTGKNREINSFKEIHEYYVKYADKTDSQSLILGAMLSITVDSFKKMVEEFVDLKTLPERMKNKKMISIEFIGKISGWTRASFVTVKADEEGRPLSVLYTTRVINEEKRKQENLEKIARADELTKLFNRHAYEEDLEKLKEEGLKDFVLVAMDLNGLKTVNDTMGHAAGDEFIKLAANTMLESFVKYGCVYRTGGDEFVALLKCEEDKLDRVIYTFDKNILNCHGEMVKNISVSRGIAGHEEFPDYSIEQLEKKADERMYQDKYQYYITNSSKSMGKDKTIIEGILRALSSNYGSIFVTDLNTKLVTIYRKGEDIPNEFWNFADVNPYYDDLMVFFIKRIVIADDRARVSEFVLAKRLMDNLKKQSAISVEFRIQNDNLKIWMRLKIAKLKNNENYITVGLENISNERTDNEGYYKIGNKILIIDSDKAEGEKLSQFLRDDYEVINIPDVLAAEEYVEREYEDIAAIIIDVGDELHRGFDFINKVNGTRKYSAIPIIAASEHNRKESELKTLELGASDFMHKPYNAEVVHHYIKSLTRLRSSVAMLNTLEKDPMTGLYTKEFFFRRFDEILGANPQKNYKLMLLDIQKFKVINEKYGIEAGNSVIKHLARSGARVINNVVLAGRISGDRICYLQENIERNPEEDKKLIHDLTVDAPVPNLSIKIGIFYTEMDRNLSAQSMCDRARLACESIKQLYGVDCAIYDDKIRRDLLIQQQILENMDTALSNEQFKVYLQPKHDMKLNKTGGAEALIRWEHPELGFINPGVFIPLFEKNGFVKEIDWFVSKKVCEILRKWKKEGKRLVPISINLSRRDFEDPYLAEKLTRMVDSYEVDHQYIHFELTESAFSDNPELIANTLRILHSSGFSIELDDFGTGYSSLTTLNNISFDILKLDMSIIQNDDPNAERNVLDFCAQLVKMMKLKSVAEGVETKDQVDRITRLGCDYIQGYFYSRPLPVSEFEKYLEVND